MFLLEGKTHILRNSIFQTQNAQKFLYFLVILYGFNIIQKVIMSKSDQQRMSMYIIVTGGK